MPARKAGDAGSNPAQVSMEHWLSGYSSAPLRRNTSGCRRFESCMLRSGEASRVMDDGSCPENSRAREGLGGSSPPLSADRLYPTGEGACLMNR